MKRKHPDSSVRIVRNRQAPQQPKKILNPEALGSQTTLKFMLTNCLVYTAFKNHEYFEYHQFRRTFPSLLRLCTESNSSARNELEKLITIIKKPLDNDPCSAPATKSVSLAVRQTVYDKFYSLVTFERLKEKWNEHVPHMSRRDASIRIGTDIVLTYDSQESYDGRSADITIAYGDGRCRGIFIEDARYRPYSKGHNVLQEFKVALGLKNIDDDDDMIDVILLALPLYWDVIGSDL